MLDTICFFCKNKFTINHSDSQYYKIKKGEKNTIYVKVAIIHFNKKLLIKLE